MLSKIKRRYHEGATEKGANQVYLLPGKRVYSTPKCRCRASYTWVGWSYNSLGGEVMLKMSVTKRFRFEAAHYLPTYSGKCFNLHGHSYKLEVEVSGKPQEDGMVVDFSELKQAVTQLVVDKLDHTQLNSAAIPNPTAENLLLWIWNNLMSYFAHKEFELESLRLWETEDCYATLRRVDDVSKGANKEVCCATVSR